MQYFGLTCISTENSSVIVQGSISFLSTSSVAQAQVSLAYLVILLKAMIRIKTCVYFRY
jgi:hypothetical protein